MASAARTFTRAISRTRPSGPSFRPTAGTSFTRSSRRGYASGPEASKSRLGLFLGAGALAAAGATGFYFYNKEDVHMIKGSAGETKGIFKPSKDDYQKVYDEISRLLVDKDEYDDGSYGPVLVRLAWHCSGTYDAMTGTGGSNGATMRFAPEGDHGANAGLKHARDFLEPVKGWCINSGYPLKNKLTITQQSSLGYRTRIFGH
jgi:cytochrome c peroxidase